MSEIQKGNKNAKRGQYYKVKTKTFFEDLGYHVEYLEFFTSINRPGMPFPIKKKIDILGADGCATSNSRFILWNSALTTHNLTSEVRKMAAFPIPCFVEQYVVVWEPRKPIPRLYCVKTKEYKDGRDMDPERTDLS
jgi:hypothetical protein